MKLLGLLRSCDGFFTSSEALEGQGQTLLPTTSTGLNCSFTAAASMTPWLQDEDGSLGSPSLNNVSLTCEQDTGLPPPRKVSKVYTNHPSLGSAIITKILKSFENKQRSIWCLHLGWDMLNDPMQKLWPLDSSLLLMYILSNFFAYSKKPTSLNQGVTPIRLAFAWLEMCERLPRSDAHASSWENVILVTCSLPFRATILSADKTVSESTLDLSRALVWIPIATGKASPLKSVICTLFQLFH